MDSRFFRVTSEPNYYNNKSPQDASMLTKTITKSTLPTQDTRYPGWAAPMSDGRIATDYRTHCYENIPAGKQFATKEWLQKNTEDIIRISRERHSKNTGGNYGFAETETPPEKLVQCDPVMCSVTTTGLSYGIGTERVDKIPYLFGTYQVPKNRAMPTNTPITQKYEGGRNTVRGRSYTDIGTKPLSATKYIS